MRALLDRYVRSLLEQEQSRDAPEYRQDLGTFIDWLLLRKGFRVVERTFRHDGAARRGARGERQWGADILAIKADEDGTMHGYRFVLKQGSVGSNQWRHEDGFLPHDLGLAAGRHPEDIKRYDPNCEISRWTIVAVHNGDFRGDQIGDQRRTLVESIRRSTEKVGVDWWDANRLVELALEPTTAKGRLEERADPDIFPPGIRPFARLAIDSLNHGTDGQRFDIEAVDRLIESVLPSAQRIEPPRWERCVSELGLLAAMICIESSRLPNVRGSVLPALDTMERVICRAAHHIAQWGNDEPTRDQRRSAELLRLLLVKYVSFARILREHLSSVLTFERGLAIASLSERVDYPIRTLRLAAYLAIACGAALDIEDRAEAEEFADALFLIVSNNPGGALNPILDDQVTELAIIWDAWNRLAQSERVHKTAQRVAERLYQRNIMGIPLPAIGLPADYPLNPNVIRILVEVNYRTSPPGFEDGGSQILPLALYLGWRKAADSEADAAFAQFALDDIENDEEISPKAEKRQYVARHIFMQSWLPPDDASLHWYSTPLANRGTVHVYQQHNFVIKKSYNDFVVEFERFNRALTASSISSRLQLQSIDRIAWKRFRNPPPLATFRQSGT